MDDALYDVGQRLDALAADDERAYHHATRFQSSTVDPYLPGQHEHQRHRHHGAKNKTQRRKRHAFALSSLLGLSAFYLRVALAIHLGWVFLGYSITASSIVSIRDSVVALLTAAAQAAASADLASGSGATGTTGALNATISATESGRPTLPPMSWPWTKMVSEFVITSVGASIGSALFGSLADHYGRRRVLLVATGLFLMAHVGVVFQSTPAKPSSTLVVTILALFRGLEGVGLGGQLVLFILLAIELAAQRHRSRLFTLSFAGVVVGSVTAVYTTNPLIAVLGGDTRVFRMLVLSSLAILFLAALGFLVRESPRFLAASGRVQAALYEVERIELAHGVHWHHQRHPTDQGALIDPVPSPLVQQQQQRHRPRRPRLPAVGALAPSMVSLGASLRQRWARVLCCRPYRSRSLGLFLFWLLTPAMLLLTMAAAGRFASIDTTIALISASVAVCVSLIISASVVDRYGRVGVLTIALIADALGVALAGLQLQFSRGHTLRSSPHAESTDLSVDEYTGLPPGMRPSSPLLVVCACVFLAGGMSSTIATGAVWSAEHYGVMVRGTGFGFVLATAWVSMGAALWLMLSTSDPPPWATTASASASTAPVDPPSYAWLAVDITSQGAVVALCTGAGLLLFLAGFVWTRGLETRARDDCDMVVGTNGFPSIAEDTSAPKKELPRHEQSGTMDSDSPTQPWMFDGFAPRGSSMLSLGLSSNDDEGDGDGGAWHGDAVDRRYRVRASQAATGAGLVGTGREVPSVGSESSMLSRTPGDVQIVSSQLDDRAFLHMTVAQREAAWLATQDMLTIETDPFEGMEDDGFVSAEPLTPPKQRRGN